MTAEDNRPSSLDLARFKKDFLSAFASRRLGGASVLRQLADEARRCITAVDPPRQAVAFVLSALLRALAEDRDERALPMSEDNAFFAAANQPMINALDFLQTGGSAEQAIAIVAALITVHETFIPPFS